MLTTAEPMRTVHPGLKALVAEASQALARMDRARLEDLAHACQALNRYAEPGYLQSLSREQRAELAEEARQARGEMAVFARVLEATRSNLKVMHRLRELRMRPIVYSEPEARGCGQMERGPAAGGGAESGHGDD
ncbi:MAG TPA: hypothetical protein VKU93_02745 [Terracidiphilus sp.]|nr:hypothetical protein [Terracidiphilus sp.]